MVGGGGELAGRGCGGLVEVGNWVVSWLGAWGYGSGGAGEPTIPSWLWLAQNFFFPANHQMTPAPANHQMTPCSGSSSNDSCSSL